MLSTLLLILQHSLDFWTEVAADCTVALLFPCALYVACRRQKEK